MNQNNWSKFFPGADQFSKKLIELGLILVETIYTIAYILTVQQKRHWLCKHSRNFWIYKQTHWISMFYNSKT